MTHLSSAQFVQQDVTTSQTNRFKDMYATLKTLVMCNPTYIHVSNTCGMLSITDPLFNAGRLGLGLYGYTQLPPNHPQETRIKELQPALNIVSTITCIQELSPGENI
jgi:alanine racemase